MLAIEFGKKHESCAMDWRRSLGPKATQADAYLACERGDYLIWQLRKGLTKDQLREIIPHIIEVVRQASRRAVQRALEQLRGVRAEWAIDYRRWAQKYLSGEDTSAESAERAVASAAVWAVARAAQRAAQRAERAASMAESAAWAAESAAESAAWAAVWVESAERAESAVWAERAAARAEWAAATSTKSAAERKRQADEIRKIIPVWLGE